jgi:methylated-DNA-[protein]-cysteine S-methyltransferase
LNTIDLNSIITTNYSSPIGDLLLGSYEEHLVLCDWKFRKMRNSIDSRICSGLNANMVEGENEVLSETKKQLDEYFSNNREEFDLPLKLIGTDFQKSVWNQLLEINFGKIISYLKLSQNLGNEKAITAVASANGANAVSIIVPCHRVIGSDGSLVGYAGGVSAKKYLLKLEGAEIQNQLNLFT